MTDSTNKEGTWPGGHCPPVDYAAESTSCRGSGYLRDTLFSGTAEEHRQTREGLEELMRAVIERRSNVCEEEDDDS